jgi:uncharacterized protein (DUF849 family)
MQPVILEAAINGETAKSRNPHVPRLPAEIAADAIDCLEGGAAIIHNHSDDFRLTGEAAAGLYGEGWRDILAAFPDAILCPTNAAGDTDEAKIAHFGPCRRHGARLAPIDPGSMNLALSGGDLGEARMLSVAMDYNRIELILRTIEAAGLGASIGIYEPGFLRAALAFHAAGRLPPGSHVKFYFFGGANYFDGRPGIGFGLDPTPAALEAYLEILGDSGLLWSVAVIGGCVFESGIARHAIMRGGHVRFGLEDHAGTRAPSNRVLLDELVGLCRALGRAPASPAESTGMIGLL